MDSVQKASTNFNSNLLSSEECGQLRTPKSRVHRTGNTSTWLSQMDGGTCHLLAPKLHHQGWKWGCFSWDDDETAPHFDLVCHSAFFCYVRSLISHDGDTRENPMSKWHAQIGRWGFDFGMGVQGKLVWRNGTPFWSGTSFSLFLLRLIFDHSWWCRDDTRGNPVSKRHAHISSWGFDSGMGGGSSGKALSALFPRSLSHVST